MKYISPITVEAEIFLNSLESLSKCFNNVDVVLVSTLEKLVMTIANFMESTTNKVVETKHTELVNCADISHIRRIFCCTRCRRDIGKSTQKVALHLTEGCNKALTSNVSDIPKTKTKKNRSSKILRIKRNATSESKKDQPIKSKTNNNTDPNTANKTKRGKQMGIKKKARNESTKNHPITLSKKTQSLLTSNLSQFIEEQVKIGTKLQCIPAYERIEDDLRTLAAPLFPQSNIHVYKFGSRIAGIGNRDSDLDLFIDIGDTFNVYQHRADSEAIKKLRTVEKAMKSSSRSWKCIMAITNARVPILKVIHAESGIECDINFSNSLGVINTKFLEYTFNLQPIAQSLCCFMKKWLNLTKLSDKINTYSMNLMVLFYLQNLGLLPSVERLQKNINQEKALKIGHWICTYATFSLRDLKLTPISVDTKNMLKYVKGFFVFYTNFNFRTNVISLYLGKAIKKDALDSLMPSRYTHYIKGSPTCKLETQTPLIVQDPFQLNENATRNVGASTFNIFKQSMLKSLQLLNDLTNENRT